MRFPRSADILSALGNDAYERKGANLAVARSSVAATAVSLLDAEGGWYATLRLPRTRSEEAWALALLQEDAVHVHPGHFFDFEREPYVVASLLTPPATFHEGMTRMLRYIEREV